jgi:hypothetical protein
MLQACIHHIRALPNLLHTVWINQFIIICSTSFTLWLEWKEFVQRFDVLTQDACFLFLSVAREPTPCLAQQNADR